MFFAPSEKSEVAAENHDTRRSDGQTREANEEIAKEVGWVMNHHEPWGSAAMTNNQFLITGYQRAITITHHLSPSLTICHIKIWILPGNSSAGWLVRNCYRSTASKNGSPTILVLMVLTATAIARLRICDSSQASPIHWMVMEAENNSSIPSDE